MSSFAYLGSDNNATGFTNNWLESRKQTHFFDQRYADYDLYSEQKGESYRDVVRTAVERNPVSDMFFSYKNIKHLKWLICQSIYQKSGGKYRPAPESQSDNDLVVVMRSIYLSNARHLPDGISDQVAELNFLVMTDMVPRAISNAQQHLTYIRDSTQQPLPMDRPHYASSAGTRVNRSVTTTFI
jgi:hypothetical protein